MMVPHSDEKASEISSNLVEADRQRRRAKRKWSQHSPLQAASNSVSQANDVSEQSGRDDGTADEFGAPIS
jgi:hypothetical protein